MYFLDYSKTVRFAKLPVRRE